MSLDRRSFIGAGSAALAAFGLGKASRADASPAEHVELTEGAVRGDNSLRGINWSSSAACDGSETDDEVIERWGGNALLADVPSHLVRDLSILLDNQLKFNQCNDHRGFGVHSIPLAYRIFMELNKDRHWVRSQRGLTSLVGVHQTNLAQYAAEYVAYPWSREPKDAFLRSQTPFAERERQERECLDRTVRMAVELIQHRYGRHPYFVMLAIALPSSSANPHPFLLHAGTDLNYNTFELKTAYGHEIKFSDAEAKDLLNQHGIVAPTRWTATDLEGNEVFGDLDGLG